eukprot:1551158-Rhodomonas_salina.5
MARLGADGPRDASGTPEKPAWAKAGAAADWMTPDKTRPQAPAALKTRSVVSIQGCRLPSPPPRAACCSTTERRWTRLSAWAARRAHAHTRTRAHALAHALLAPLAAPSVLAPPLARAAGVWQHAEGSMSKA